MSERLLTPGVQPIWAFRGAATRYTTVFWAVVRRLFERDRPAAPRVAFAELPLMIERLYKSEPRPHRVRIEGKFDPKWLSLFAIGFVFSVAYYGALIWLAIQVFRTLATWVFGPTP